MTDLLKNDQLRQAVGDQAYSESNLQLKRMLDRVFKIVAVIMIPVAVFALLIFFALRVPVFSSTRLFRVGDILIIALLALSFIAIPFASVFRRRWHNKKLSSIGRDSGDPNIQNLYYVNSPKGSGYIESRDDGILFHYPGNQPLSVSYSSISQVAYVAREQHNTGITELYCMLYSTQGVFVFRVVDSPGERPNISGSNPLKATNQALLYTGSLNEAFYKMLSERVGADKIQDLKITADYEHNIIVKIVLILIAVVTVAVLLLFLI